MPQRERIRDKYPAFYAYGGKHKFLSNEEALATTRDERIRSVWPFITKYVLRFQRCITARERANFDPEDILTELWVKLAEKDHKWTPERGKYITFVGKIVERELISIRDRAGTVQSPRNASCRINEYEDEEGRGVLSARRRKTYMDIQRTKGGIRPINPTPGFCLDVSSGVAPPVDADAREASRSADEAVKAAIKHCLTPVEAGIMGRLIGLWGQKTTTPWLLAFELQQDEESIKRIHSRACVKIRDYLESIGHPIVSGGE